MHEFYFHEDDVGQRQILPVEWRAYCEREFAALKAHHDANFDPNSSSWGQLYQFRDPDEGLPGVDLTEGRFIELLKPHGKQFEKLDSPLAEIDEELGIRAVGFGPSIGAGLVADLDGDRIAMLWCNTFSESAEDKKVMADLLTALSTDQHLLLVDWAANKVVDLRDRGEIGTYLAGDK